MNVATFVEQALTQIVEGVFQAQMKVDVAEINPKMKKKKLSTNEYVIYNPASRLVEFDIAVTASESSEKKGNIGVITDAEATSQRSVSRLKFSVLVRLPAHK